MPRNPRNQEATGEAAKTEPGVTAPAPLASSPFARVDDEDTRIDTAPAEVITLAGRRTPVEPSQALNPLETMLSVEERIPIQAMLAGQFDTAVMDGANSPKRNLERLIHSDAFRNRTQEEQSSLLKTIAHDPRDIATPKAALAILEGGFFDALDKQQRQAALTLFARLSVSERPLLAQIASTRIAGRPSLSLRDATHHSLAYQLVTLSQLDPAPEIEAIGLSKNRIMQSVLSTLTRPSSLPADEVTSNIIATLEFALATRLPAEFVRLWVGLAGPEMRTRLAGGSVLDLGERLRNGEASLSLRESPLRLALEELSVIALPRATASREHFLMPGGQGIDADVVARGFENLLGRPYHVLAGVSETLTALSQVMHDPSAMHPTFVSLITEDGEQLLLFDRLEGESLILSGPSGAYGSGPKSSVKSPKLPDFEEHASGQVRVRQGSLSKTLGIVLTPQRSHRSSRRKTAFIPSAPR